MLLLAAWLAAVEASRRVDSEDRIPLLGGQVADRSTPLAGHSLSLSERTALSVALGPVGVDSGTLGLRFWGCIACSGLRVTSLSVAIRPVPVIVRVSFAPVALVLRNPVRVSLPIEGLGAHRLPLTSQWSS